MNAAERATLRGLLDRDVIDKANSLCARARKATAPGGGHELRAGETAIPWVCAALACESLGQADKFTEDMAQKRSAVRPKDFKEVVRVLRVVLAPKPAAPQPVVDGDGPLTYEWLVRDYAVPAVHLLHMREIWAECRDKWLAVEPGAKRFLGDGTRDEVVGAVFWVVCSHLNIPEVPDLTQFCSDWQIDRAKVDKVVNQIEYNTRETLAKVVASAAPAQPDRPSSSSFVVASPEKSKASSSAVVKSAGTPSKKRVREDDPNLQFLLAKRTPSKGTPKKARATSTAAPSPTPTPRRQQSLPPTPTPKRRRVVYTQDMREEEMDEREGTIDGFVMPEKEWEARWREWEKWRKREGKKFLGDEAERRGGVVGS